jgi:glycine/D-amino acid oxidase-like deaminating enzyme
VSAVEKADVIVVGGGLFGRIITHSFRRQGRRVISIDAAHDTRGSNAAGCVMKPSWLSKLGDDFDPCMDLLAGLYSSFSKRPFRVNGMAWADCYWVRPDQVLLDPMRGDFTDEGDDRRGTAHAVVPTFDGGSPQSILYTTTAGNQIAQAPLIVVAAGIWTEHLLPELKGRVTAKWGIALRSEATLESDFIRQWAPYRQVVGVQLDPGLAWSGDGSALNLPPVGDQRQAIIGRALVPGGLVWRAILGARPYAKLAGNQPALLEEVRPGVWAATGGAKNGTAAAAWCALKLREMGR